jgi:ribosomal protein L40E
MAIKAGIVCGACDRLNPIDRSLCEECGSDIIPAREVRVEVAAAKEPEVPKSKPRKSLSFIEDRPPPKEAKKESPPVEAAKTEEEEIPMEQARHYICKSCYSPVPSGHKFCGKCGTSSEDNVADEDPNYFGDMQTPGKAKLILIKGEGMDGISYHLNSTEHVAGRVQGAILFTEDKWLSPKHANFYYTEEGELMVRDEDSVNGVFLCLRGPVSVTSGTVFQAGEQLFRVEEVPVYNDDPEEDGTYCFSSPRRDSSFRVIQILEGGGSGMVVHSRDNQVSIGREDCDMNFPNDPYMSGGHLKVEFGEGSLRLVDLGSKNGTYTKIENEHGLGHGDYLFLGRQLLRVEITN